MNSEYNSRVSSKNSERLLKNLQNTTGDYFFLPHPVVNQQLSWREAASSTSQNDSDAVSGGQSRRF